MVDRHWSRFGIRLECLLMSLEPMTQAKWVAMTPAQRDAARDNSGLHPLLKGLEGRRVTVTFERPFSVCDWTPEFVLKETFRVGKSTGWKPCHLSLHNRRSRGGGPVPHDAPIKSVIVID